MNVNKLKRETIVREGEEKQEDNENAPAKRRKLGRFKALLGPALAGLMVLASTRCADPSTIENYVPFPDQTTDAGTTDSDADTDSDVDSDVDSDSDTSTDSGTDTGTDTDSGTDTETSSDVDTDTDTDTDSDVDTDSDSDTDADTDSDSDSDTDTPDGGTTDGGTTDGGVTDGGTTDSDVDTDADTDSDSDVDTDADTDTDIVGSCGDVENDSWGGLIGNGEFQTVGGYTVIYVGEDIDTGKAVFDIVCEGSNDPVAYGVFVEEDGEESVDVPDDGKVIRIECHAISADAVNVDIYVEDPVEEPDGGTDSGTDSGTEEPECVVESPVCETAEPGCFDGLMGVGDIEVAGGYKFVFEGQDVDENGVFTVLCAETDALIAADVIVPEDQITVLPVIDDCMNITIECFAISSSAINVDIYVENI